MTGQTIPSLQLGYVALRVSDVKRVADFYEQALGLSRLNQSADKVELGIAKTGKKLLELLPLGDSNQTNKSTAGLYHMAFLVPTRKDFGNVLRSLLRKQVAISGAADHGYSEALYLDDPEGNGIEIYWDKPHKFWDIRDDGTIAGVTEQLDVEGVLNAADGTHDALPPGTILGHVHLSVSDLADTRQFYTTILGLDLKYQFGRQADFYAAGLYHHQIAANTWQRPQLPKLSTVKRGLAGFTIEMSDEAFNQLLGRLKTMDTPFKELSPTSIRLTDPNGIPVSVSI